MITVIKHTHRPWELTWSGKRKIVQKLDIQERVLFARWNGEGTLINTLVTEIPTLTGVDIITVPACCLSISFCSLETELQFYPGQHYDQPQVPSPPNFFVAAREHSPASEIYVGIWGMYPFQKEKAPE